MERINTKSNNKRINRIDQEDWFRNSQFINTDYNGVTSKEVLHGLNSEVVFVRLIDNLTNLVIHDVNVNIGGAGKVILYSSVVKTYTNILVQIFKADYKINYTQWDENEYNSGTEVNLNTPNDDTNFTAFSPYSVNASPATSRYQVMLRCGWATWYGSVSYASGTPDSIDHSNCNYIGNGSFSPPGTDFTGGALYYEPAYDNTWDGSFAPSFSGPVDPGLVEFADASFNGLKTITFGSGQGSFKYYYNKAAWEYAYATGHCKFTIVKSGSVYRTGTITPATLIVAANGEIGPAGGGTYAIPDEGVVEVPSEIDTANDTFYAFGISTKSLSRTLPVAPTTNEIPGIFEPVNLPNKLIVDDSFIYTIISDVYENYFLLKYNKFSFAFESYALIANPITAIYATSTFIILLSQAFEIVYIYNKSDLSVKHSVNITSFLSNNLSIDSKNIYLVNSSNPESIGVIDIITGVLKSVTKLNSYNYCAVDDNYLYVTRSASSGFLVYDKTTFELITTITTYSGLIYVDDLYVYVSDGSNGVKIHSKDEAFTLVNTKSLGSQVSDIQSDEKYIYISTFSNNKIYIYLKNSLTTSVSSNFNTIPAGFHLPAIDEKFIYATAASTVFKLYNKESWDATATAVSESNSIIPLAYRVENTYSLKTIPDTFCTALHVDDIYVYVGNGASNKLSIYDKKTYTLLEPKSLQVAYVASDSDRIYVGCSSGSNDLKIYNKYSFELIQTINVASVYKLWIDDSNIYVIFNAASNSVQIFDKYTFIEDANSPIDIEYASAVHSDETYLYIGNYTALTIYDKSDLSTTLVGVEATEYISGITSDSENLYVCSFEDGVPRPVKVFLKTDFTTNIQEVATLLAHDIVVDSNIIYISDEASGTIKRYDKFIYTELSAISLSNYAITLRVDSAKVYALEFSLIGLNVVKMFNKHTLTAVVDPLAVSDSSFKPFIPYDYSISGSLKIGFIKYDANKYSKYLQYETSEKDVFPFVVNHYFNTQKLLPWFNNIDTSVSTKIIKYKHALNQEITSSTISCINKQVMPTVEINIIGDEVASTNIDVPTNEFDGTAVVVKSPNNTRWLVSLDDNGILVTTEIAK